MPTSWQSALPLHYHNSTVIFQLQNKFKMLENRNGQYESVSRKEAEEELKTLCCCRNVIEAKNLVLQIEKLVSGKRAYTSKPRHIYIWFLSYSIRTVLIWALSRVFLKGAIYEGHFSAKILVWHSKYMVCTHLYYFYSRMPSQHRQHTYGCLY